jgi:hypothetical protein
MEVIAKLSASEPPLGTPIAIMQRAPMPPVLIEGYTRCMAALRMGQQSIDLFFASPEPATAVNGADAR